MTVPAKYAGLPDIDDAADVYETHDPPSINPQHDSDSEDSLKRQRRNGEKGQEGGNGNGVDGRRLVPGRGRVRQVFGRRERGMRDDEHRGDASSASSSEEETDPSDSIILRAASRTRETPQARLRRLKYEMNQLERDLRNTPSEPSAESSSSSARGKRKPGATTNRELLTQLAALRDRAEGVEMHVSPFGKKRAGDFVVDVGRVSEVTREQGKREGDRREGSKEALGSGYVAELDRRLHVLEQRIGTGTVDETTLPDSILATLRKTSAIQSLLITPHTLDAASRRVKVLLADLARVSAAGKQQGVSASQSVPSQAAAPPSTHPDETEKITAAYALLPRLDPILPLLSPLLTRLRALATLHANASTADARLVALERLTGRSSRRVDEACEVVQRVEYQLAENSRAVEANWKSVEVRLGDLRERLGRIG
ncbi:hypothetical protein NliqN6_6827 [Naganishia liquefaciens]|uniref:Uncharacterized protein n=1 Tax=Naganishia liquefaciens TaxID=104408 RepID=A0A8H3U072_9TREE|nr:hypothetical protein NliqN6_6827 [Naganishia liquefaciens]